jgi:hypothetical protein
MQSVRIRRREALAGLAFGWQFLAAQGPEFVCPMDKDVRAKGPGNCPRCGMRLVAGIPDQREYRVEITTAPGRLVAGKAARISLRVVDPDTGKPVRDFEVMHEKLFHMFLVGQDLQTFAHVHPEFDPATGTFQIEFTPPKAGMYRILSDFFPTGGTPQLVAGTVLVPGTGFLLAPAAPLPDMAPQRSANLTVELVTEPPQPLAGFKTLLFFRLSPADGVEPYLGAMGHMLAASSDLIDMMHAHPIYVTDPDGGAVKQVQFNLIFPRPGVHRLWVQFQRAGVVNTVAFNVPVEELH